MPFSREHEREIEDTERIIVEGGQKSRAAPRGDGKTTRIERATIWGLLSARRRFPVPIGPTERHAANLLKRIKVELKENLILWSLFRSELWGIPQLANNARLCIGQLSNGVETQITWAADRVVMPTLPNSLCSGSVLAVGGLTGAIRGMSHVTTAGEVLRPDLVLLDDPQTRESAKSALQTADREAIIEGDVLGLAGPGHAIAAFMLCTVIARGDLSDRYLDRIKHPEWQGHRSPMVYAFPTSEVLWEQYRELRAESFRIHGDARDANAFYKANRKAMDDGAEVSWQERYDKGELSAIQSAMNLRFRDEAAFFAEYQNEPLDEPSGDLIVLKPADIMSKTNGLDPGLLPRDGEVLTAHIDVHDEILFYVVSSFKNGFTGAVVERGTYPPQTSSYFTLRKARKTLKQLYPGMPREAVAFEAVRALIALLTSREWKREGDIGAARLNFGLVDCGYLPNQVEDAIRAATGGGVFMPSRGLGIGASDTPLVEREAYKQSAHGDNWYIGKPNARNVHRIYFDANYWKTFLYGRLATPQGAPGSISFFGKKPLAHQLIADHLTAEDPHEVFAERGGRRVVEWRLRAGRDNHWLDNLVGCCVAASRLGVTLQGKVKTASTKKKRRRGVSYLK